MDIIRVVNTIPNNHSNETNQDSEPSIAVNPANPAEIAITAFTPPDSGVSNAPVYVSTDAGATWALNFDIPGGSSEDQSVSFATEGGTMYGGTLTGSGPALTVFRAANPTAAGTALTLEGRTGIDQPWAETRTVSGKDHLYLGYNNDALGSGVGTATVDVSLDAGATSPTFSQIALETRSIGAGLRDGYAIRPVAHADGTIYVVHERWTGGSFGADITTDIVVSRDDNWAQGSSPFQALTDPGDNLAGRLVATGVTINDGGILGQERLNNDLAIAVDPGDSDIVCVAWADNAGPNYTLRVRRSLNRGVDWSGDLLTVDNATMTCLAINTAGVVGLMYQQVNGSNWETHFRRTTDGTGTAWDDVLLSKSPSSVPTSVFQPYLGDWARVVAVGRGFYGVFCANNTPDPANFPQGVTFARNHSTSAPWELLGADGTTAVATSIDPFFFSIASVSCTVVTDRSTFGEDEVNAMLHLANPGGPPYPNPAVVSAAFYVQVDGFSGTQLGVTAATLSGVPNIAPAISFAPTVSEITANATSCAAEDPAALGAPQRFTWTYELRFSGTADFGSEVEPLTMTASITPTGESAVTGEAIITLTTQPDPYEIDGPTSWLSVDLQVFNILEGGSLPTTPGITLNAGPNNDFITRLLADTGGGYNDPTLPRAPNHPFDLDLVANENTSSVSIAGKIGSVPVYNFAVARVRYRALSTPASNVRTFFRLFQASTTSTDYQPTTTYLNGGSAADPIPLLGVVNNEVVTIPCFAAARVDPTNPDGLNAQPDPVNVGPVGESIPPDPTGNEVQVYFGCWLDINQPTLAMPPATAVSTGATPYTPARSVQDLIRGQHTCLVAEIFLEPPEPQIQTGETPATSDKLAQRNLNIVGVASPHVVPVTFDVKPTPIPWAPGTTPDELMFDWGSVPAGAEATIYLPGTSADTILKLASALYSRHDLSQSDAHTIRCPARGLTYVPVPPGAGSNYAGLLTIEVPATVRRGSTYDVLVRQIRNVTASRRPPPPPPPRQERRSAATESESDVISWRQVIGSFQVSIPVIDKAALLNEERLLSVMRWIDRSIPRHDRWHPVFRRYLAEIGGRVAALGGDPGKIIGSWTGDGLPTPHAPHLPYPHPHPAGPGVDCRTGKISGLVFDHFGDFEGFVLETRHGEHNMYRSRERNVAELADRAWKERLRIRVCAEPHHPETVHTITILEPPVAFGG